MSSATQPQVRGRRSDFDESDPWRYGWRYINETQPDGTVVSKQVPLTAEDVLHPQEDDFIVTHSLHVLYLMLLLQAIRQQLASRPDYVCLSDHRIDWGVAGVLAHGPDITVFRGVHDWRPSLDGTFYVAARHAEPLLAIEVTSPSTRSGDLNAKVREYYQAGLPQYVIVDLTEDDDGQPIHRLLNYEAGPTGYILTEPGNRLWLESVQLSLAIQDDELVCLDEHGQRLGDLLHEVALKQEFLERAECEAQARAEAEKALAKAEKALVKANKARAEADKARAEAEATAQTEVLQREALAAKVQALEAELAARAAGQQ